MTEKKYRTLGRAGEDVCDISGLPGRVSVITNTLYRNAITLNPNGQAYMAQLSSMDNLKYENGVLYFKGLPATNAELRELCTKETAPTIDLMLLRSFYTMVLNSFEKTYGEDQTVSDIITLYVPQLAKYLGLSGNLSRHQVVSLIEDIIMSILEDQDTLIDTIEDQERQIDEPKKENKQLRNSLSQSIGQNKDYETVNESLTGQVGTLTSQVTKLTDLKASPE